MSNLQIQPDASTLTYFMSGHLDLTREEFDLHYKPQLDLALENPKSSFVVGDARGADRMCQEYILEKAPNANVFVFHMFTAPRFKACDKWKCVGGFQGDDERDMAMTSCSDRDIAWIRPGREKSGTAKNIKRRNNDNL